MTTPETDNILELAEETSEPKKDFVFDLNRWNYKRFKAFRAAVTADNEDEFAPMLAEILVDWPFDKEINGDTVVNLGLKDMAVLISAANIAIEKNFRTGRSS